MDFGLAQVFFLRNPLNFSADSLHAFVIFYSNASTSNLVVAKWKQEQNAQALKSANRKRYIYVVDVFAEI